MSRGSREYGDNALGKTSVLMAGTVIERVGEDGELYAVTLAHDVVLPSEQCGWDTVVLGGHEWEITHEAWGWVDNEY